MLLRLSQHPSADALPLFYEDHYVMWRLDIPTTPRTAATLQPLGARLAVPTCHRTSGVLPALAADHISYTLGWSDDAVNDTRAAQQHTAFVNLLARLAAAGHKAARAAVRWYLTRGPASLTRPPGCHGRDLAIVAVGGHDLIDDPVVQKHWRSTVINYKGTGAEGECLVCGLIGPLMRSIPSMVSQTLLPGADKPMALVSNNSATTQYGLADPKQGLASSPICATCAHRMMAGLRAALQAPSHIQPADQDVRHAWWYTTPPSTDWIAKTVTGSANPGASLDQLRVDRDRCPDDARVYSVMLGASSGRVATHHWLDISLREALSRLVTWWERIAVARGADIVVPTLTSMIAAQRPYDSSEGRYNTARKPHPWLYRQLASAALEGRQVPGAVVASVLRHIRSDGHLDTARIALLGSQAVAPELRAKPAMRTADVLDT